MRQALSMRARPGQAQPDSSLIRELSRDQFHGQTSNRDEMSQKLKSVAQGSLNGKEGEQFIPSILINECVMSFFPCGGG